MISKKMFSRIKSESGFTLVEMMVVAGVVSVLAIGFAAYLYQMSNQTAQSQSRANMNQLQINMLNASGKQDALLSSESLQSQNYGTSTLHCTSPCEPMEYGGVMQCVYDCSQSMTCPQLPDDCINVNIGGHGGGGGHH